MSENTRLTQTSVTCFLHFGDEYLFLERGMDKKIDPSKLNGIGGRLNPGENYLEAAIREIREESGYDVIPAQMKLSAVVKLEGGYDEDWVMNFFKVEVTSKNIPIGDVTSDGKLLWIQKDQVMNSGYELVDDLNYLFEKIANQDKIIFATAEVDDKEKITKISISEI